MVWRELTRLYMWVLIQGLVVNLEKMRRSVRRRHLGEGEEDFLPEIESEYAEDWTPAMEKAFLQEAYGSWRFDEYEGSWRSFCDSVASEVGSAREKTGHRFAQPSLVTTHHGPLELPMWDGPFNKRYLVEPEWGFRPDTGELWKFDGGFMLDHERRRGRGDGFEYFLHRYLGGLEGSEVMRAGSLDRDGDRLVVSPAVLRGRKLTLEEIVAGYLISTKTSEYGGSWYDVSMDFMTDVVLPALKDKEYDNPFEFALDWMKHIKGAVESLTREPFLMHLGTIEANLRDIAIGMGNCASDELLAGREYDLSNPLVAEFYEKVVDVFGDGRENAEIMIFVLDNIDRFGSTAVLDDDDVVDLLERMPMWVRAGFVVDRATDLYRRCDEAYGDVWNGHLVAAQVALRICDNLYGMDGERPWWFNENEDLAAAFDIGYDGMEVVATDRYVDRRTHSSDDISEVWGELKPGDVVTVPGIGGRDDDVFGIGEVGEESVVITSVNGEEVSGVTAEIRVDEEDELSGIIFSRPVVPYGIAKRNFLGVASVEVERVHSRLAESELCLGLCPESAELIERFSVMGGPYFVHAIELYKASGYRLVDQGVGIQEACEITTDVARWYAVYNVVRGIRVLDFLLHMLSQVELSRYGEVIGLCRNHIEANRPGNAFISRLQGQDASVSNPGANLILGIGRGEEVNRGMEAKDSDNLVPGDFDEIGEGFLALPLTERVRASNPYMRPLIEDRRNLLLTHSPVALLEGSTADESTDVAPLERYMRFSKRLRNEGGHYSEEVAQVYFHLFAPKVRDPLDPPKNLLIAIRVLLNIHIPREITRRGLVRDDDSNIPGMTNETARFLGIAALLDAQVMGLVTEEHVARVLHMIAVGRPNHDKEWDEIRDLKAQRDVQEAYIVGSDDESGYSDVASETRESHWDVTRKMDEDFGKVRKMFGLYREDLHYHRESDEVLDEVISSEDRRYTWQEKAAAKRVRTFRQFHGGDSSVIEHYLARPISTDRLEKVMKDEYVGADFLGLSDGVVQCHCMYIGDLRVIEEALHVLRFREAGGRSGLVRAFEDKNVTVHQLDQIVDDYGRRPGEEPVGMSARMMRLHTVSDEDLELITTTLPEARHVLEFRRRGGDSALVKAHCDEEVSISQLDKVMGSYGRRAGEEPVGMPARVMRCHMMSDEELRAMTMDWREAMHVLQYRRAGASSGFIIACVGGYEDEGGTPRHVKYKVEQVLKGRYSARDSIQKICIGRFRGIGDVDADFDDYQHEQEVAAARLALGFSGRGDLASRYFLENIWKEEKISPLEKVASERDKAHSHRLYDVMGPLADVGVRLTDAMNLVRMGVLSVEDLRLFAAAQLDGVVEAGSVRLEPVSDDEIRRREEIGDEARNHEFLEPIDIDKVEEMVAAGVFNIAAFREAIRSTDDIEKVVRYLSVLVDSKEAYQKAVEVTKNSLRSVESLLDRDWVGFSPGRARERFMDTLESAKAQFVGKLEEYNALIAAIDPDAVKFLNLMSLAEQFARFERAVIEWFTKIIPKDSPPHVVAAAVGALYGDDDIASRNVRLLSSSRSGWRSHDHTVPRTFEEMRQLSDGMLKITSRILAYIWMSSPEAGGHLVDEIKKIIGDLGGGAGPETTAIVARSDVGRLGALGDAYTGVLEELIPLAEKCILEARRKSAWLLPIGSKVHTQVAMNPAYFELVKEILGIDTSYFRLAHGHEDKTLVLPPASSSLEVSLLINSLVLFGVIPLKAADVRRANDPEGGGLPDAQICFAGRLNAEHCAIMGSATLLATDDGVRRYDPDAFLSNDSGAQTGARMMIYDGGAANLVLPFLFGIDERTDVLGRRSTLDLENGQLVATVLSHFERDKPLGKFAPWFKVKYRAILERHGLEHVLEGSWVHDRRSSYTRREQEAHLDVVHTCTEAWHVHATEISEAERAGLPSPPGIITEVNGLIGELRAKVEAERDELIEQGMLADELEVLLQGEDLQAAQ